MILYRILKSTEEAKLLLYRIFKEGSIPPEVESFILKYFCGTFSECLFQFFFTLYGKRHLYTYLLFSTGRPRYITNLLTLRVDVTSLKSVWQKFFVIVEKDHKEKLVDIAKDPDYQRQWPYLFSFLVREYVMNDGVVGDIPAPYQITSSLIHPEHDTSIDWLDTGICAIRPSDTKYEYLITEVSLTCLCLLEQFLFLTLFVLVNNVVYPHSCYMGVLSEMGSRAEN